MDTVVGAGEMAGATIQPTFLKDESWVGPYSSLLDVCDLGKKETSFFQVEALGGGDLRIFVQTFLPPVHLVIFGGWLDVTPLLRVGQEMGFQVTVVDARKTQSSLRNFAAADSVWLCSPREAVTQIPSDERTVAVVMNHHFERDQEALEALTELSLPFVGMLGPKRRRKLILESLKNSGVNIPEAFEKNLHGPVGLDLGAETPAEIAVSIIAEILAVLNDRNAKPIRERVSPLHSLPASLAYA
jgi:xanthine/CO dehydrogenase XdhC/CoxF family maturation factor